MVTKKFVVDGLRLNYDGIFDINDFYKQIEDWIRKKGMEKEIKKKLEYVNRGCKQLEFFVELWKKPADYAKAVVRLRALFDDIKEVVIVKNDYKKRLNKGKVVVILDGILESDIEHRWQTKPTIHFLYKLFDMFIYKFHTHRFENQLATDVYELHKYLTDFFNRYKF